MENYYLQISSKKLSILHSLHFRGLAIKIESRHICVPSQWWHYLKSDMRLWRIVLCRQCTERCYINWLEAAARHITRFTAADYRLQRKNFFLLVSISFLCKKNSFKIMSTQANAKNILKLAQAVLEEGTCTICYESSFFDKPCESIHTRRTWSRKFLVAMNGVWAWTSARVPEVLPSSGSWKYTWGVRVKKWKEICH